MIARSSGQNRERFEARLERPRKPDPRVKADSTKSGGGVESRGAGRNIQDPLTTSPLARNAPLDASGYPLSWQALRLENGDLEG